jgi:hypothetical protein
MQPYLLYAHYLLRSIIFAPTNTASKLIATAKSHPEKIAPTAKGRRFLNVLLERFL